MQYPYQHQFRSYLQIKQKSPVTVNNYDAAVAQFFTFLIDQGRDTKLHDITENDVRAYLAALQDNQSITIRTYNKVLSQLNSYFSYLLSHRITTVLPTLTLHGKAVRPDSRINTKWLFKLDTILGDDHIHFYTRLTLLLCSRGYTVHEFLQPGFERIWKQLAMNSPAEQAFRHAFTAFITPLQDKQQSSLIFLKRCFDPASPGLTNAGLHKYLRRDQEYLGFSCAPKYLHQAYVMHYLATHRNETDQELERFLNLDPASLNYYRRRLTSDD